jgi:hypothetical protein
LEEKTFNTGSRLVKRSKGEKHMPFRRTISIDDVLHSMIQKTRGEFLSHEIDVDYTRSVNMLLALGLKSFNERKWSAEESALIRAYVSNDKLKWESIIDEAQDEFIKNLPSIVKQIAKEEVTKELTRIAGTPKVTQP